MTENNTSLFITLEGGEGVGKSTVIAALADFFKAQRGDDSVVVSREPGATSLGATLRSLILAPSDDEVSDRATLFLFLADRAQHITELVRPALAEGKVVILDRFIDSTQVYQTLNTDISEDDIKYLSSWAASDTIPDITFVLDGDPKTMLERTSTTEFGTLDKFESKGLEFHEKVREGYRKVASENPERCILVDAHQNKDELLDTILGHIVERFLDENPESTG